MIEVHLFLTWDTNPPPPPPPPPVRFDSDVLCRLLLDSKKKVRKAKIKNLSWQKCNYWVFRRQIRRCEARMDAMSFWSHQYQMLCSASGDSGCMRCWVSVLSGESLVLYEGKVIACQASEECTWSTRYCRWTVVVLACHTFLRLGADDVQGLS